MLTKTQFCKSVVGNFEVDEGRKVTEGDIYQSSTLAVAMEHLGMLKSKQLKDYAAERGGILFTFVDEDTKEIAMLSARELIRLLPG
jgi:hypothetical protein